MTTTYYDTDYEIATAVKKQPQRKAASPRGVWALLEQLVSDDYRTKSIEVTRDENYIAAFNCRWLRQARGQWADGFSIIRHEITPEGREVLAALRDDFGPVPYDEHSAEWFEALALYEAREVEAPKMEDTQLFKYILSHFATRANGGITHVFETSTGATIGTGAKAIRVVSGGLTVAIERGPAGLHPVTPIIIDEATTPEQIKQVVLAVSLLHDGGRIGKETYTEGPSVVPPTQCQARDGWVVESHKKADAGGQWRTWTMARGIVLDVNTADFVSKHEVVCNG